MLIAPGFMSMLECRGTAPLPSRIRTIRALLLCQTSWNYQPEFGGCFTSTNSLSCTTQNGQKWHLCGKVCNGSNHLMLKKPHQLAKKDGFRPKICNALNSCAQQTQKKGVQQLHSTRSLAQVLRLGLGICFFFLMFSSNLCG